MRNRSIFRVLVGECRTKVPHMKGHECCSDEHSERRTSVDLQDVLEKTTGMQEWGTVF
jgi:hypothetical protein